MLPLEYFQSCGKISLQMHFPDGVTLRGDGGSVREESSQSQGHKAGVVEMRAV